MAPLVLCRRSTTRGRPGRSCAVAPLRNPERTQGSGLVGRATSGFGLGRTPVQGRSWPKSARSSREPRSEFRARIGAEAGTPNRLRDNIGLPKQRAEIRDRTPEARRNSSLERRVSGGHPTGRFSGHRAEGGNCTCNFILRCCRLCVLATFLHKIPGALAAQPERLAACRFREPPSFVWVQSRCTCSPGSRRHRNPLECRRPGVKRAAHREAWLGPTTALQAYYSIAVVPSSTTLVLQYSSSTTRVLQACCSTTAIPPYCTSAAALQKYSSLAEALQYPSSTYVVQYYEVQQHCSNATVLYYCSTAVALQSRRIATLVANDLLGHDHA